MDNLVMPPPPMNHHLNRVEVLVCPMILGAVLMGAIAPRKFSSGKFVAMLFHK